MKFIFTIYLACFKNHYKIIYPLFSFFVIYVNNTKTPFLHTFTSFMG